LAESVTFVPTVVEADGLAPIEHENAPPPPPPPEQERVLVAAFQVKLGQLGSSIVTLAACEGVDVGTARMARVNAEAASAYAAGRTNDRIIFDSQAEGRSGGLR
jgi:hypothetical protein